MAGGIHVGSGSHKKKGGGGRSNKALLALVLVAFVFSSTTMLLISHTITRSVISVDDMDAIGRSEIITNNSHRQHQHATTAEQNVPTTTNSRSTTISDLITWILLSEEDKDANTQHAALLRLNDSPVAPLEFPPGTLSLTHARTLRHCYADPKIYGKHFQGHRGDGRDVRVSYSDKHKLAYVMLPKSGSSTARYMLKNEFDAREGSKSLQPKSFEKGEKMEGYEVITFVRDPLSRFYSQYDEAYVRTAPWQKGNPFYRDPAGTTKKQQHTAAARHPFSHIYDGIYTYHDYEDVFCPTSTRKSRKDCIFRKSHENGTLASRFERFVQEYDGRDPFDVHLTLQVPMLSSNDGLPLHMTQIYNTTDSKNGWKSIAKQFLGENAALGKKNGEVIAGRSYPRRFNSDLVSVETQRRICQLALLDYCCLNLPLPDVCKGKHYSAAPNGGGVKRELLCVMDLSGHIQPGIFPDER